VTGTGDDVFLITADVVRVYDGLEHVQRALRPLDLGAEGQLFSAAGARLKPAWKDQRILRLEASEVPDRDVLVGRLRRVFAEAELPLPEDDSVGRRHRAGRRPDGVDVPVQPSRRLRRR
jgi:hypothetical protein